MAYEYPSAAGLLRLMKVEGHWIIHFSGRRRGRWRSPDEAALAAAHHKSGLADWDRKRAEAPNDLIDWRPIGDSI
jgi:hypothetical protein